jgi:glycosyltransferase involved in cell wall biosynthesis
VKVAIVVQRYGANINGGAELHARYIAEHLAKHVQVEVVTTCASDYITWRNELPPGAETVNGIIVRRFQVTREREPAEFGRLSQEVFTRQHAVRHELEWLEAEGPNSPELVSYLKQNEAAFDFFIFFSVRYYHAYYGARAVPHKAVLVPTAERDGALGLSIFAPLFRGVRAFMYNSFEERALIQAIAGHAEVPGVVVGVGSEIPAASSAARFRQRFNFRERFAIYVGRIDENKGCAELFDYFQRYARLMAESMHLVLIGNPIIPIPDHPRIHHLGFVSDQDKFDALAASELLIMPSYLESLSMVALEAWALGKPVIANGRCDVLQGQCIRSNGGLYYDGFAEFTETLRAIDFSPSLAAALGRNGRDYFNKHYSWPVIERKYLDILDRLSREPSGSVMEPVPGWLARRRRDLPPAEQVVANMPSGPALAPRVQAPGQRAPAAAGRPELVTPGPQSDSRPASPPPRLHGSRPPRRHGHRAASGSRRRHGGRPRRRSGSR